MVGPYLGSMGLFPWTEGVCLYGLITGMWMSEFALLIFSDWGALFDIISFMIGFSVAKSLSVERIAVVKVMNRRKVFHLCLFIYINLIEVL